MTRRFLFVFLLGNLAWAGTSPALASTITLTASKHNTLIQQTNPASQLSNALGDIFAGRTNQDGSGPATVSIRRGLVEFDVAGNLPAGAHITDVTLTMQDVQGLNGSQTITLNRVLADWGQGTSFFNGGAGAPATQNDATWLYRFYNAANPASSPAWTMPGGDFNSTASGSAVVTTAFGPGHVFSWLGSSNPQMIADVQDWLDHPADNFGWAILGNEATGQTAKRFNETVAGALPSLIITYAVPEPSGIISLAIGMAVIAAARRHSIRRSEAHAIPVASE